MTELIHGELPDVRAFQEWLNEHRMRDVSEVFHAVVAKYREMVLARDSMNLAARAQNAKLMAMVDEPGGIELLRKVLEEAEAVSIRRKLQDPVAVHVAMLRGEIAKPDIRSMLHLHGEEALAKWDSLSKPKCGRLDERCDYLSTCGSVCNKCGNIHNGLPA